MKKWIIVILLFAAAGAAGFWWKDRRTVSTGGYRTATVDRGDIVQAVRATGTVQPIRLVDVGTQVNGPVRKLYVDFNDRVKQGDLVAQIDPTVYEARLAQDEAGLIQARAEVEQAQARQVEAEKELARASELARKDMLSQSELDTATASRDTLAAQVRVAQASVKLGEASLRLSKANLDYTTIRSPVDGVVIARNVSEGQTVVASMSAQVLFEIATDLRKVQVEASIPEADIGRIRLGQSVSFSVDAYDEEFRGTVSQIRMAASNVQNVVTYPVIILANNPDLKLFPGMTANISCEVARRAGVLRLPNAALRFKPSGASEPGPVKAEERGRSRGPKVWVPAKNGEAPRPAPVKLGITDGSFTEVEPSELLREGAPVIIGVTEAATKSASTTVNPFAPRPPGRGMRPPH